MGPERARLPTMSIDHIDLQCRAKNLWVDWGGIAGVRAFHVVGSDNNSFLFPLRFKHADAPDEEK